MGGQIKFEKRNGNSLRTTSDYRLHPLIHTLLKFNLAQDIGMSQRLSSLGNSLPQTEHTSSVGLINGLILHAVHLTERSLVRSISAGSRLVIRFHRFSKTTLSCLEKSI